MDDDDDIKIERKKDEDNSNFIIEGILKKKMSQHVAINRKNRIFIS